MSPRGSPGNMSASHIKAAVIAATSIIMLNVVLPLSSVVVRIVSGYHA